MSTTVQKSIDDVLTEARAAINDSVAPFRFSNVLMLSFLNTALNEVYRYRPDLFIAFSSGILSATTILMFQAADLGLTPATPLPCDPRLTFNAIVYFVAGRTELSDDEFTDDGRALLLLKAFQQMLQAPGG